MDSLKREHPSDAAAQVKLAPSTYRNRLYISWAIENMYSIVTSMWGNKEK